MLILDSCVYIYIYIYIGLGSSKVDVVDCIEIVGWLRLRSAALTNACRGSQSIYDGLNRSHRSQNSGLRVASKNGDFPFPLVPRSACSLPWVPRSCCHFGAKGNNFSMLFLKIHKNSRKVRKIKNSLFFK
jgi:hypothetical protein